MNKTLFKTKEEFNEFYELNTGYVSGHGTVSGKWLEDPKEYPCVLVWTFEYDEGGPDTLEGEFVYQNDFLLKI